MPPIIKLKDVSVVYNLGKSSELWGLRDVSLEIFPDEYIIFFGPSGSGKSTLLNVIAGLEKPSRGEVYVADKNIGTLNEQDLINLHRSTIGIIFQAFYLIGSLTIKDNILLPQLFKSAGWKERVKEVKELSEKFDITNLLRKRPNELSGGQQQRVAAARALINDPEIILADEPVGNLDTKNAEIMMQLLELLNTSEKKTVVLVTHDPRYLPFAHRVFHIKDGSITKVTINTKKKLAGGRGSSTMLEQMAELYPYSDDASLRAKLVLNQLFIRYSLDEQQAIEASLKDFLSGKTDEAGFKNSLESIRGSGGVPLARESIHAFVQNVIRLSAEMNLIQDKKTDDLAEMAVHPMKDKVIGLRHYLLDAYPGELSFEKIHRLDTAIYNRLKGNISSGQFEEYLDIPYSRGGAGLNRRTARNFTRAIDLVLSAKEE